MMHFVEHDRRGTAMYGNRLTLFVKVMEVQCIDENRLVDLSQTLLKDRFFGRDFCRNRTGAVTSNRELRDGRGANVV